MQCYLIVLCKGIHCLGDEFFYFDGVNLLAKELCDISTVVHK